MKRCRQCGRQYAEDYFFCLDDGSALAGHGSQASMAPTQVLNLKATEEPRNYLPYAIIALLLVVVGSLTTYILIQRKDGETANTDFKTVTSNQKTSATSVTASPLSNENTRSNSVASGVTPFGRWTGDWSSPSGAYLTTVVTLNDNGGGYVEGQIEWTLVRTMRPEKMSKIGSRATEYIRGRFDPTTRTVTLAGYRKDDPDEMLVMLDQYKLDLSPDGRKLNGKARNGGKWNGKINLSR